MLTVEWLVFSHPYLRLQILWFFVCPWRHLAASDPFIGESEIFCSASASEWMLPVDQTTFLSIRQTYIICLRGHQRCIEAIETNQSRYQRGIAETKCSKAMPFEKADTWWPAFDNWWLFISVFDLVRVSGHFHSLSSVEGTELTGIWGACGEMRRYEAKHQGTIIARLAVIVFYFIKQNSSRLHSAMQSSTKALQVGFMSLMSANQARWIRTCLEEAKDCTQFWLMMDHVLQRITTVPPWKFSCWLLAQLLQRWLSVSHFAGIYQRCIRNYRPESL